MGTRLFVDGIPSFFTAQQLKELFIPYGTGLSAEVTKDQQGRSLRFGYVEMAAPHEAKRAILGLHRSNLYGRPLLVMVEQKNTSGSQ